MTNVKSAARATPRQPAATPEQRQRRRKRQPIAPYIFVAPVFILFVAFKLYPYIYAAWLSLTSNRDGANAFVGIANFARVFSDTLFYKALLNTGIILVIQVPLMLTLAILLAVALNSKLLRFRAFWRTAYFIPIVMGLVAYGILFSFLLRAQNGLLNDWLGIVGIPPIPWLTDPFWAKISIIIAMTWHYTGQSAIIYLAQLQSIPGELYEAAKMDGANARQRFFAVTLPGLRPALILTVILSTIGTLQLFDEPYVLTNGGPDNATLTIGIYLYQNAFKYFDFGYASAIGYVLTGIIAIITIIQLRVLNRGQA